MEEPRVLKAWNAGRVRRWHTHPDLSATDDYVDGHAGRVALMALILEPNLSRSALIYALTHDHGEAGTGDISRPIKRAMSAGDRKNLNAREARHRACVLGYDLAALAPADEREVEIVALCDAIDSYLWMAAKAPHLINRKAWGDMWLSIKSRADNLDVGPRTVIRALGAARRDY